MYHVRKSPWINRRAEGKWEGQISNGWMDGVTKDTERLGVRNRRIKARDRDVWRRLLESAKTLNGL
jgi:hypothetical protein